MNVLVIGLGSMGRRRIRLIKRDYPEIRIAGVDREEARRKRAEEELQIRSYSDLEEALSEGSFDSVFVSTPPLTHAGIIRECLMKDLHVFTELNLVDDFYEENMALAEEKERVLFLSSTFLYRKEIQRIKQILDSSDAPVSYTYHTGQYLPDWHPWENYKSFFVSDSRTSGCREIMAIELPWIVELFGDVTGIHFIKRKNSSLEIDYDDSYYMILEHKGGNVGTMVVDVVSRKAVRNLEVFGETLYLTWDGRPEGLCIFDLQEKKEIQEPLYDNIDSRGDYSATIIENAYADEIKSFFETIQGLTSPRYTFEKDKKIIQIINQIETGEE